MMSMESALIFFVVTSIAQIAAGFYCAYKLSSDHPLWVRLIVLSQCFSAMYSLWHMYSGDYVAYPADAFDSLVSVLLSALVASVLSGRSWLDIRKAEK